MRFPLVLLFFILIISNSLTGWTQEKPNVVVILVDDLGWTDLTCYGSTFYETPNLDKLASEGARFTQFYAASPVCSPTRASIQTGKYPSRDFHTTWFGAPQPWNFQNHWTKDKPLKPAEYDPNLSLDQYTLAKAFKDNGYRTFFAGKWHLGEDAEHWPENYGYDINIGGNDKGAPSTGSKYFSPYKNPRLEDGPEGEYLPLRLARETAGFIEKSDDKPFFAFLSFYSVHTPLMTTPELEAKYLKKRETMGLSDTFEPEGERKNRSVQSHAIYAGMVEAMDQAVGIVMESLRKSGLDKNTIVMFTSDNGGLSTAEGSPTSNLPLRAGKGWLYEGGIREPFIVKWNGKIKAGQTLNYPTASPDIFPTLAELCKLNIPQDILNDIDGKSLGKALIKKDKTLYSRTLFWHFPHYGNQGGGPGSAIQKDGWKLIRFYEDGKEELYHIPSDIGEKNNLLSKNPEKAAQLRKQLEGWLMETDARYPTTNESSK